MWSTLLCGQVLENQLKFLLYWRVFTIVSMPSPSSVKYSRFVTRFQAMLAVAYCASRARWRAPTRLVLTSLTLILSKCLQVETVGDSYVAVCGLVCRYCGGASSSYSMLPFRILTVLFCSIIAHVA